MRKRATRLLLTLSVFGVLCTDRSLVTSHPGPPVTIAGAGWSLVRHWVGRWPLALECAYADVPYLINYQGRLTDASGKSVAGSMSLIFRLYDAETSGTELWKESQTVSLTSADNGLFNVILGSSKPFTGLSFNSSMWLSVQVSGDVEMTPRQRLTATGYAINASTLNGVKSESFLRSDLDTSASGKLTLTRSGTAFLVKPTVDPAADTTLMDIQNAAGTSKFSVDLEGDTTIAGNLTVTGTIGGSTSSTGTTNASWNVGSASDATTTNLSLLLGQTTGQESLVWQGASTGDFVFSDDVRLDGQSALKLVASSGSNFVALKAPSSVASSVTWTLPGTDGSANQVLVTNGSGALSFATAGGIGGVGDITGVTAGTGLTGGGTSGDVTVTLSTPVSVANGGTGLASGTSGGILGYTASGTFASSTALTANALMLGGGVGSTPSTLASLGTSTTLLHGNASGAPTFSAVSLTADVSGVLPLANGGTNAALGNCTSGQALTVTGGAAACTSTITSNDAGTGTTNTTFTIDSDATGTEPANGAGLKIEGGSGDVNLTWVAADDRLKLDQDMMIDTATFSNTSTPRGGLFIAEDTTASNSAGAIFLGRRSAETSGWNVLQGKTNGHLFWNGDQMEIEGDSPSYMVFGTSTDSTIKYAMKFNPDVTPKTFSMIEIKNADTSPVETTLLELKAGGRLGLEFTNLVHNGSFEAFSALEKFKNAGYSGVFQHGTTAATAFEGGWENFAPDEWVWVGGKIVQHSPIMLANVTASMTTDAFHGKSAVGIKDGNTAATYTNFTAYPYPDGAIKQVLKNMKPDTTYAIGVKAMVSNAANSTAKVDIDGDAAGAGQLTPVGVSAAGALSTTATSFTDLIGTFKTTSTGGDISVFLLCQQTGTPAPGDMCRFDAIQVMAGKSVPEFAPNNLVDSGDQTLYGLLRIGRTTDSSGGAGGGILAVDRFVRTRGVEFFKDDPGFTGKSGGIGTIGPPNPSTTNAGGSPGTLTLTTSGTYTGSDPVEYKVRINGTGNPNTFVWKKRPVPSGSFGADSGSLTVSASAQAIDLGVQVAFNATTGGALNDEWLFGATGMAMGDSYTSFTPTATYTPGDTRLFVDPFNGKLTFQEGTKRVTLEQITSDIAQPAVIDFPTYSGVGTLSVNTLGTYAGPDQRTYEVIIDTDNASGSTSADKFKWHRVGGAFTAGVAIPQSTTQTVTLEDGIQLQFFNSPSLKYNEAALNDKWTFAARPATTGSAKVSSVRSFDGVTDNRPQLNGAVRLVQGSNVSLTQSGQDITVNASLAGADGKDVKSSSSDTTANFLATELAGGIGISVSETGSGDTKTTIALDATATLAGNPTLPANGSKFASTGLIFEGATADTNEGLLTVVDPTADRTWTLPNLDGTVTVLGNTTTGSGSLVLATSPTFVTDLTTPLVKTTAQGALQLQPYGTAAGNTGEDRYLELAANGTNYVGFKAADALAGNVIWTLPIADGTSGQLLKTNGSGALAWVDAGGAGTVTSVSVTTANGVSGSVATATTTPAISLTLGAITPSSVAASGAVTGSNLSGTNTGDQTITLTGDVTGSGTGSFATTVAAQTSATWAGKVSDETGSGKWVFDTTPTFTTNITDPLVIGGTGTASPLTLRSTSGVGAAGADLIFQTGNNGATEAMRILNSGNVGIGTVGGFSDTPVKLADPATLPLNESKGASFSPDGTYLAIVHYTFPYITIYKRSGDTFTKLADPATPPASTSRGASFSPDGTYLAIAHGVTPFVTIYKRSGDTFTKLANPATLPASTGFGASFSPDGTYLAIAHDLTPFVTIYKRSGDTFTKLADPAALPAGTGRAASFSPDGTYLAIGHSVTPFVTIYKRSGDTFTKLANPATLPANQGFGASFSPDGTYLAIAVVTSSPPVTIYKRSGDTFTKLADPATLPPINADGASFSPDGTYLAITHFTTPFVTIYKGSGSTVHRAELATHTTPDQGLSFGKEVSLYRSFPNTLSLSPGNNLNLDFGQLSMGNSSTALSVVIDANQGGYFSGLSLNPNGTGAGNTGELRFSELVANGTNYNAFKSPDALAGDVTYTLPTAAPVSNGLVLSSTTAGVLSWAADAAGTGTVTSVGSGAGLTGGPITASGTLALDYTATLAGDPTMAAGESRHASTGIIFEGATADPNEGLLTVVDPTADRTWTLPNVSGTLITTGDTGTVTSAMVGSDLANADIAANAAIDYSKLAALTSANILVGSAGNVATSVAMSGNVTIDNTGATTIASQTSATWAGKVSDETGSGKWVFDTSPTIATPTVSGNITYSGTQPKRTIVLTAAGAIIPASNAPQQLQTNGTNVSFYTLNYKGTGASPENAYWQFIVPGAYTGTTVNATLYWLTSSVTTTNGVKWFVAMNGLGDAQTLDAALQTEGTVTDNPSAVADQVLVTTQIANVTTGWVPGEYAIVKVKRDAADVADTETADAKLLMIKLEWTASAESD